MFCLCPCSGRECLNTQALAVRVPFYICPGRSCGGHQISRSEKNQ